MGKDINGGGLTVGNAQAFGAGIFIDVELATTAILRRLYSIGSALRIPHANIFAHCAIIDSLCFLTAPY